MRKNANVSNSAFSCLDSLSTMTTNVDNSVRFCAIQGVKDNIDNMLSLMLLEDLANVNSTQNKLI